MSWWKKYITNTHFYNAIKKYVWDGFTHEIFAKNLSKEDAMAIEMLLIEYFQTTNPNMGYVDVDRKDIQNAVLDILKLNYISAQYEYPCDKLEAHIDLIYLED